MKIFYDWEFIEDGKTILPISLGMVTEDENELYVVFENIMIPPLYGRIIRHKWLMENVIPHLPLTADTPAKPPRGRYSGSFRLDRRNPAVQPRTVIRERVRGFLDAHQPVELWGYYASYDHVLLAQLFGTMLDRPHSMPSFTNDIVQFCHTLGRSELSLPAPPEKAHNALEDARWTRMAYEHLIAPPRLI